MSYIELPAEKVRKMAEEKAGILAEERAKAEKSWWRRLWGLKVPSDQELWEDLSYGFLSTAFMAESYAWRSQCVAERLLKAASLADVVRVSVHDLDMIS